MKGKNMGKIILFASLIAISIAEIVLVAIFSEPVTTKYSFCTIFLSICLCGFAGIMAVNELMASINIYQNQNRKSAKRLANDDNLAKGASFAMLTCAFFAVAALGPYLFPSYFLPIFIFCLLGVIASVILMGHFMNCFNNTEVDPPKANPEVPANYVCQNCGATNCKLWRYAGMTDLMCAKCAAKDQDENIRDIDDKGMHFCKLVGTRMVQIGSYVPAIPYKNTDTYWQFTKVPQDLCDWWNSLPTLPRKKAR